MWLVAETYNAGGLGVTKVYGLYYDRLNADKRKAEVNEEKDENDNLVGVVHIPTTQAVEVTFAETFGEW